MNPEQLKELGPLAGLAGVWVGETGNDTAPGPDRDRMETPFRERIRFVPGGLINNHEQNLQSMRYRVTVWRLDGSGMFHEELGYMLWDPDNKQILRAFSIPRGMSVLAGGDAEADARSFTVKAEAGSDVFGIVSNPFLDREFKTVRFSSTYRLIDDKTFEYEQDTEIQMKDKPDLFHHVDRNRLTRIAGPH